MKKLLCLVLAVLFGALLLSGCGSYSVPDQTPSENTESIKVYTTLIELLRAEIEELKAEQNASEAEYEAKLKELEELLKQNEGKDPDTGTAKPDVNDEEPSPFTYKVVNGEAVIIGYSGKHTVLVIPEKLGEYPVTAIDDSVFSGNTVLTSVSLPQNLKTLGWFAFSGCTSLKSATIPANVKEIGYDAFSHCTKLTIYCEKGSYAEKFAASYGIAFVAN